MVRLNTNLMRSVPEMLCESMSESHITVALLNIRSIIPKTPDIEADSNLASARLQCFCETWLDASQSSPVLLPHQIDIRCDRMTCENRGGVMIYVPNEMNAFNTQRFVSNGIEAVSTTLQLSNIGNMQIAVVYRSPSILQTTLISLLSRLLTHVSYVTLLL